MDALPPNDPNRNNNNNNSHGRESAGKNVPPNPRRRSGGPRLNENGEMDVFLGGNVGDDFMIVALFFMGTAAWLLREVCTC
mmetsp:Transcript_11660/g.17684  ORF Transcript_11660/g.17684 Transcript_11660/m.17684 type:complete len:81 (+) Transcript_11660:224-466(+)